LCILSKIPTLELSQTLSKNLHEIITEAMEQSSIGKGIYIGKGKFG